MQVKCGKVHKYLGITLDYTTVGQAKITMFDYIDEILNSFDKSDPTSGVTKSSSAPDIIFKVNEDCKKLNTKQSVEFHHLVEKILFPTKQAKPDTCTAVSLLTTILREPDNKDWANLVHLMKYNRGESNLPLTLSANGSGILKICIG